MPPKGKETKNSNSNKQKFQDISKCIKWDTNFAGLFQIRERLKKEASERRMLDSNLFKLMNQ